MKKLLNLAALLLALSASAQPALRMDNKVRKANYDLAERFSQKKTGQMVYSTRIRPNWFAGSDKFW